MVFDMIANAPGVLVSTLQWGRLQDLGAAGGDPDPVLSLNPTVFDFEPPKVYAWNVGVQQKLWKNFIFDLAYVGSESKDLLRQVQINAVAVRRHVPARRTRIRRARRARRRARRRCPTTCCGPIRVTATSGCGTTAGIPTTTRSRPR